MDLAHDYLELATPAGETIKVLRKSHPRARRLRLTVTPGGARVTYPEGTHPAQVFAFLRNARATLTVHRASHRPPGAVRVEDVTGALTRNSR